ncbi:glycosyltransferase family 4 protein [Microcoleus sp. FACHB-831]|uniref:glycosyltransferase family 4 protein n=1 Tax=Microcoleus sp. FACHB-831 TaxID=2692827 RepID=UPI0016820078|nr:glycosyltransferase family 1 protein [Microcoleus sp. FACHB-831]MBD1924492.1 glycosyltransferase family 4 protein [Microcoleus sp. FACHB-831]
MKVGLYLKNLKAEVGGGSTFETAIFQSLLKYGADSGHKFMVFTRSQGLEKEISAKHIEVIPIQRSYANRTLKERLKYKLNKTTSGIFKQVKVENLEEKFVLNSGVEIFWYLELGTYDYLTMEIPYITTVWDLEHRNQPYFPEVSTGGRWEKRDRSYGTKIQRSAAIITGTEAGKAEIERFYQVAPERIKVIPYPTPNFALNFTSNDEQQVLNKYNIPAQYLFYPAQFWPHKNHAALLLALQFLRDEHNLVLPLVLVGADKGNQQYIQKLVADLNLSNQVHFLGFVPQEDLMLLYRNAFALTFTTLYGPDNLPPLEAFALGCPVVASIVAGANEQLGDAALLVDAKDEKQLAMAIKSLYDNPELRSTLVQRGLERASRWTGGDYMKSIFSILDEFKLIRRCWSSEEPFRRR